MEFALIDLGALGTFLANDRASFRTVDSLQQNDSYLSMSRVFFSYASEDRSRLTAYVSQFQTLGIEVLIDYEQIGAGYSIPEKINEMVRRSDGAVMFYSEAYDRKPWTKEEQNALLFRAVDKSDYRIVIIRLGEVELPPLLAHRLWTKDSRTLATAFAPDLRQTFGNIGSRKVISGWLEMFRDDELERMATAIQAMRRSQPSAVTANLHAKRTGNILIHLFQPVLESSIENLSFILRMLPKLEFIRNDLREQRSTRALGQFEAAYMLAEQAKLKEIEDFRQELRITLDALVERVTLVEAPQQ